jgi:site-specific DNA-methyltransferase (adenine-specific)/site-specific DNA-methyltransferase (cytosine-N4-specific)
MRSSESDVERDTNYCSERDVGKKIEWTIRTVNVSDLSDFDRNPRQITEKEFAELRKSVQKFGMIDKPIVNTDMMLIGGHRRTDIYRAYGLETIDVWWPSRRLSKREVDELNIRLNKNTGSWDFDALANFFDAGDLCEWGFEEWELGIGGNEKEGEPETPAPELDRAEELREKYQTEHGQLWRVGRHRLLCGDCRDPEQVDRLLEGIEVNVTVTSPPYASQRKYDPSSGFKPIRPKEYGEWFEPVQANIARHLANDGSFFLNIKEHSDDGQRHLYVKDLTIAHVRQWGWRLVDEFCWERPGVPGSWPNRFKNAWEPVFHFTRQSSIKFRPQNVTEIRDTAYRGNGGTGMRADKGAGHTKEYFTGEVLPSNVLAIAGVDAKAAHDAMFPVGLPTFFIKAFSDEGDKVFEPFSGSGTTLVAAEETGRDGYGMEISPAFIAVSLERLSAMGLEPELV